MFGFSVGASSLVETVRSPKINASSTYDDWGVGTGLAVVEGRARVELKLARVIVRPGTGGGGSTFVVDLLVEH